jgi:hypothetical protein
MSLTMPAALATWHQIVDTHNLALVHGSDRWARRARRRHPPPEWRQTALAFTVNLLPPASAGPYACDVEATVTVRCSGSMSQRTSCWTALSTVSPANSERTITSSSTEFTGGEAAVLRLDKPQRNALRSISTEVLTRQHPPQSEDVSTLVTAIGRRILGVE